MPLRIFYLAAVLLGLALAPPIAAQETQIPVDSAGRIETISASLRERLGLFPGRFPNFREARLFRTAEGAYILEVTGNRDGRLVRERVPFSEAEVGDLRRQLSAGLAAAPQLDREGRINQEGRYLLLGQTTTLGLVLYATAVPTALGLDDEAFAATYLLTAGASFFGPYVLTQDRPVTYGMANLSRYGASRGAAHGALLYAALAPREEDRCERNPQFGFEECYDNGDGLNDQALATALLAGSLIEGIGGYRWARSEGMSAGRANTIGNGGDLGLLTGFGTALVTVGDEDDDARVGTGLTAAGGLTGIYLGDQYSRRRPNHTWGDAEMMWTAGALGAYGTVALLASTESDNARLYGAGAVAGAFAGAAISDRLVRDTDFTLGQSLLNRLGTVAGGVAGLALGVLTGSPNAAAIGSAAGGIAGYALTYSTLAPAAREQQGERLSAADVADWQLRFSVAPSPISESGSRSGLAPTLTLGRRF